MFDLNPIRKNRKDFFDIDRIFSEFLPDQLFHSSDKAMYLDIKESEFAYLFEVELPGVKKENVELTILDDRITISVRKEEQLHDESITYIRKERKYGVMSRSFSIPNVDYDQIKARFEDGILFITLPKVTEEHQSKRNIIIE